MNEWVLSIVLFYYSHIIFLFFKSLLFDNTQAFKSVGVCQIFLRTVTNRKAKRATILLLQVFKKKNHIIVIMTALMVVFICSMGGYNCAIARGVPKAIARCNLPESV